MKAYWVTGLPASVVEGGSTYCGTLTEAHKLAKSATKDFWRSVFIDEVEIHTDKAAILRMLNAEGNYQTTGDRIWTLTPRGGLGELTPEEVAKERS